MKIHVCGMSSSTQNDKTVQGHHVHYLVSKHTSTREGSKGNTCLSYAGFKCCTLSLVRDCLSYLSRLIESNIRLGLSFVTVV